MLGRGPATGGAWQFRWEALRIGSAHRINDLPGMDESIAYALAARGISTQDDLAELAADEISDIDGMGMERASALILAARASEIARLEQAG